MGQNQSRQTEAHRHQAHEQNGQPQRTLEQVEVRLADDVGGQHHRQQREAQPPDMAAQLRHVVGRPLEVTLGDTVLDQQAAEDGEDAPRQRQLQQRLAQRPQHDALAQRQHAADQRQRQRAGDGQQDVEQNGARRMQLGVLLQAPYLGVQVRQARTDARTLPGDEDQQQQARQRHPQVTELKALGQPRHHATPDVGPELLGEHFRGTRQPVEIQRLAIGDPEQLLLDGLAQTP